MNILIFTGAGASVELGVPAMRTMTEQLLDFLDQQDFNNRVLSRLREHLEEPDYDMESLVDQIDSIVHGLDEVRAWKQNVELSSLRHEGLRALRHDAEWFVQHVCERVRLLDARHLWGSALREMREHDVTLVTTNYDRSVELGAAGLSVRLDDGFGKYNDSGVAEWRGYGENGINYLKLHGSTNWYRSRNGGVYKLRHPMKLFGDLSLTVPSEGDNLLLNSALVLPSREKVKRRRPYDDIGYEFRNGYERADIAFFVGSSLRDPDIKTAVERCSKNTSVYIVDPDPEPIVDNVNGKVKKIKATASQFLCSILPVSIKDSTTHDDVDEKISYYENKIRKTGSILEDVVRMFNKDDEKEKRYKSIERLAELCIPFVESDVKDILKSDASIIKRYALGLVSNSPDKHELTNHAKKISNDNNDEKFEKELEILENKIIA